MFTNQFYEHYLKEQSIEKTVKFGTIINAYHKVILNKDTGNFIVKNYVINIKGNFWYPSPSLFGFFKYEHNSYDGHSVY